MFRINLFDSCPCNKFDAILNCELLQNSSNILSNHMLQRNIRLLQNSHINILLKSQFYRGSNLNSNKTSTDDSHILHTFPPNCLINFLIVSKRSQTTELSFLQPTNRGKFVHTPRSNQQLIISNWIFRINLKMFAFIIDPSNCCLS